MQFASPFLLAGALFCSTENGTSGTNGTALIMNNLTFYFYRSTSSFTLSKVCNNLIYKYLYFSRFVPLFGKMEQK